MIPKSLVAKRAKIPRGVFPSTRLKMIKDIWHKEYKVCQWKCCGKLLENDTDATMDHIIAKNSKGNDSITNLKLSCARCNTGRDAFGGCIAALACYSAVVGNNSSILQLQNYALISGKAQRRVDQDVAPRTVYKGVPTPLQLVLYGKPTTEIIMRPDAKILYSDVKPGYMVRHIFKKARQENYDAVWLIKQGKLHVLNNSFESSIL